MKKKFLILGIALMLTFIVTITAFATQPQAIAGYFDGIAELEDYEVYCFHTGEDYGVPDGFITGCVVQPYKPGIGEHGTWTGTVGGSSGTCEYNLRSYMIDGIARFALNQCTGDLAGFHMQGTGWAATGMWEGTYHFDP